MNTSAKERLLGWICLLMGLLPVLFLITTVVIGFDFGRHFQLFMMFLGSCLAAGVVGCVMALFFWRRGPISLFQGTLPALRSAFKAPLWVIALGITVLCLVAGIFYSVCLPTSVTASGPNAVGAAGFSCDVR